MSDEQKILDRILVDAENEARIITLAAKKEADAQVSAAKEKADAELEVLLKDACDKAEKAAARTISSAEMAAKKHILSVKQSLLEDTISAAYSKLLQQTDDEYGKTIISMLSQTGVEGGEVLLSKTDYARISALLEKEGYIVSKENRDITGGFILRKGNVEYNYSFASILAIQREEIESIVAGILFD